MFSRNSAVNIYIILFAGVGLGVDVGDYFQIWRVLGQDAILILQFDN